VKWPIRVHWVDRMRVLLHPTDKDATILLGPSEGVLGGQDAPSGFPASGRNAYPSEANAFFADVVQTYLLHKSTSLLPDHSHRLPRMRLVQTYRLHQPRSLLPESSDRLRWGMFLLRVRTYLFNLVMILCTHKWYMIQVHWIITLCRCKC